MAGQTSMLHVRVDDKLKTAAAEKLASLGLTVSDAVRILPAVEWRKAARADLLAIVNYISPGGRPTTEGRYSSQGGEAGGTS